MAEKCSHQLSVKVAHYSTCALMDQYLHHISVDDKNAVTNKCLNIVQVQVY